jgi:acyl dehydratase
MPTTYGELQAGYEFPPGSLKLDADTVARFLQAVDDNNRLYSDRKLAPPMAVAALAMAALSNTIGLPPGSIHVSQELQFKAAVNIDHDLTSYARISRAQKRGKLHIIAVDLDVRNSGGETILAGTTSFILPQGPE